MSKCSIFHKIFKYMIFQRHQKALLWSKGLILIAYMKVKVQNFKKNPELLKLAVCQLNIHNFKFNWL